MENYTNSATLALVPISLFQETYNKKNYEALHPTGPKHDYAYHTEAMDRAMQGGIDDVGLGVLFGLEQYRYEFCGLLMHAEHLEAVHGVGPHTISVPRICPADDIDPGTFSNAVNDDIFAETGGLHPYCCTIYRHDRFHPRARNPASGCYIGHFPDLRRLPHQRGRLSGAGAPPRILPNLTCRISAALTKWCAG